MRRYEVELTDEQARAYDKAWPVEVGRQVADNRWPYGSAAMALADAIRAQPPKPAEPTEFGAMVKDRDGSLWVNAPVHYDERPWVCEGEQFRADYADIDAVEVIR